MTGSTTEKTSFIFSLRSLSPSRKTGQNISQANMKKDLEKGTTSVFVDT